MLEFLLYSVLSHKATVLATTKMRNNVILLSGATSNLMFEISLHLQSHEGCQSFSLSSCFTKNQLGATLVQGAYTSSYRVFGGLINKRRGLYPPGLITRIEKAHRRFFGTSLAVTDQSTFYIYWFLRYSWRLIIAFLT